MNNSVSDDVQRFLQIGSAKEELLLGQPPSAAHVLVTESDNQLRISYHFTPCEVETLQVLSQVTGITVDWLAKDAASWLRSYIFDLRNVLSGQLTDLLDERQGMAWRMIPPSHRKRTREFISALNAAEKAAA